MSGLIRFRRLPSTASALVSSTTTPGRHHAMVLDPASRVLLAGSLLVDMPTDRLVDARLVGVR